MKHEEATALLISLGYTPDPVRYGDALPDGCRKATVFDFLEIDTKVPSLKVKLEMPYYIKRERWEKRIVNEFTEIKDIRESWIKKY